jgi:hypothetical protein
MWHSQFVNIDVLPSYPLFRLEADLWSQNTFVLTFLSSDKFLYTYDVINTHEPTPIDAVPMPLDSAN